MGDIGDVIGRLGTVLYGRHRRCDRETLDSAVGETCAKSSRHISYLSPTSVYQVFSKANLSKIKRRQTISIKVDRIRCFDQSSQVCQHTSAYAAPWNRYSLGRNFRQGFVAISAHGQQAPYRHQSAFLPAHVSVAQKSDNQMVRENARDENNEDKDGHPASIVISANEGTGRDDKNRTFVDLEQILKGSGGEEQAVEAAEIKTNIKQAVDHDSDGAQSYLERLGVIQKGKGARILETKKDLYGWKLQPVDYNDKDAIAQIKIENDQRLAEKNADGVSNTIAALAKNGDAKNRSVGIISAERNIGNSVLSKDKASHLGGAGNLRPNDNNGVDGDTRVVKLNNSTKPIGYEKPEDGKVQNIQGILRANSAPIAGIPKKYGGTGGIQSIVGGSLNKTGYFKTPVTAKDYLKGNETGNRLPKALSRDSVGDLLSRAGVIPSGKNQQPPLKHDAVDETDISKGNRQEHELTQSESSETHRGKHKVCVEFLPGTGNILFQFASAYAIARDLNMTLAIPERIPNFSEAFDLVGGVDEAISFDQPQCEGATSASNFKRGIYDETFLRRLTTRESDIKLRGYFQSFKYFEHWEEELRDILTFKDDIMTKAMEAINVLHFKKYRKSLQHSQTSEAITLVGVHIRRHPVDGRQSTRQEEGYRVAPHEYIQRAMAEMRNRHSEQQHNSSIRFFVVSDDEVWAEARLGVKDLPDTMLVTGLSWATSLALLANMDHVITTVGALGWWGAWLADGDVIYYQDFLEPGSKMDAAYLAQDFFPPSWASMV
ncbi:galactoside 2-alpha-L-fucosyltransferase [Elysia marginata]|uniref:L-Fucosyltransferase n=1 Tax=Elysia marginata TaxID=1093978 RepID=A0AAV4EDK1_9GAST|nr:galactoside 2-alpha-L-fucosyltransferase [Elysia marginata]